MLELTGECVDAALIAVLGDRFGQGRLIGIGGEQARGEAGALRRVAFVGADPAIILACSPLLSACLS